MQLIEIGTECLAIETREIIQVAELQYRVWCACGHDAGIYDSHHDAMVAMEEGHEVPAFHPFDEDEEDAMRDIELNA